MNKIMSSYEWSMEELMGEHIRGGIKHIFNPFIRFAAFWWFLSVTFALGTVISIMEFLGVDKMEG